MSSKFINLSIKNIDSALNNDAVVVEKAVRVNDISSIEKLSDGSVVVYVIDSCGCGETLSVDTGLYTLLREISELEG